MDGVDRKPKTVSGWMKPGSEDSPQKPESAEMPLFLEAASKSESSEKTAAHRLRERAASLGGSHDWESLKVDRDSGRR
jgi:hypothetical protein